MRRLVAIGAAALLVLAVAVPLTASGATATPKTVTGSFIGTTADGTAQNMFRFEVRTDASGAVTFGYYQQQPLNTSFPASVAVVESAKFFRTQSGAKAAELYMTECNVLDGTCSSAGRAVVVVTDGTPDTFCGGTPDNTCQWPFSVTDGNIAINMGGQNGQ